MVCKNNLEAEISMVKLLLIEPSLKLAYDAGFGEALERNIRQEYNLKGNSCFISTNKKVFLFQKRAYNFPGFEAVTALKELQVVNRSHLFGEDHYYIHNNDDGIPTSNYSLQEQWVVDQGVIKVHKLLVTNIEGKKIGIDLTNPPSNSIPPRCTDNCCYGVQTLNAMNDRVFKVDETQPRFTMRFSNKEGESSYEVIDYDC